MIPPVTGTGDDGEEDVKIALPFYNNTYNQRVITLVMEAKVTRNTTRIIASLIDGLRTIKKTTAFFFSTGHYLYRLET